VRNETATVWKAWDQCREDEIKTALNRLVAYEDTGMEPEEVVELNTFAGSQMERMLEKLQDMTAERDELQKAFALACRALADQLGIPELPKPWKCWQDALLDRVKTEQVCRVCGCTDINPCPGGCSWVEEDLCSACAGEAENEDSDAELPPGVVLPVDLETGDIIYDETDQELFDGGAEEGENE
jgi:hypothetical protein